MGHIFSYKTPLKITNVLPVAYSLYTGVNNTGRQERDRGEQMDTSKPLALLYVRVSTNRQATTGHSLESQTAPLIKAAEKSGYRVQVITETGSGRNLARPELNKALKKLAKGEAQALYALDTDRLARSTMHLLEIAQAATKQNWRLVITSADVDTSTPAGEAFLTMAAAFAQFESRMISERVKRQHQAKRDRGEIWGATTGLISPLPKPVRNKIIKLRAKGLSLREICNTLTDLAIPTVLGGQWYPGTIKRVLDSPLTKAQAHTASAKRSPATASR
jgi:site-specific DNA recombinase